MSLESRYEAKMRTAIIMLKFEFNPVQKDLFEARACVVHRTSG